MKQQYVSFRNDSFKKWFVITVVKCSLSLFQWTLVAYGKNRFNIMFCILACLALRQKSLPMGVSQAYFGYYQDDVVNNKLIPSLLCIQNIQYISAHITIEDLLKKVSFSLT